MNKEFYLGIGLLLFSFGMPLWIANHSEGAFDEAIDENSVVYEEVEVVLSSEPGLLPTNTSTESTAMLFPFVDLEDHWAKAYVEELYEAGVVSGTELFRPEEAITRAELLTMVGRAFYGTISHSSTALHFEDVPYDHPYFDVVAWAYESGLASGSFDGNFYPDSRINRATGLKVLLEGAGFYELKTVIPNYPDVLVYEDWYAPYSSFAKTKELISGSTNGAFIAEQPMSRAEASKLIVEIKKLISN